MKFAHCTDIHYAAKRASFRKNRISERGLELIGAMIDQIDDDTDFIVNGGDLIQFEKTFDPALDKVWMQEVRDAFNESGLPVYYNIGNYDIERTGGIEEVGKILRSPHESYFFDHIDNNGDKHRVIILNQEFQAVPNDQTLYPWNENNLELVRTALATAPDQSVTIFSHSPCDDFDHQQMGTALRGFNVSNNFRPNSSTLRQIMEDSGKNVLFVAGHTHIETRYAYRNVRYITVQGMTEATSNGSEKPFERWISVERNGQNLIKIKINGYKAEELTWSYNASNSNSKNPSPDL